MVTEKSRKGRTVRLRRLKPIPPPRSVEELAREQGILGKKFDYVALASAVWPTMKDVEAFEEHLRDARRKGTG